MAKERVRPQILLFGDSITEQSFCPFGWGAALAHTFSRKADVLVRGYGGYNTRWALFLLNRLFPLNSGSVPSATIISFGANDASLLGRSSGRMQHVSLDEYKNNLIKIVTHLKEANPSMAIILVTPAPINENSKEQNTKLERTNETTGKYARKCVQLAHEMNLPFIDLWSIMQQTASWQTLFFSDELELTKEGNELVHKEVVRALNKAGLCVENMQLDFPHFSQVDEINPQRAFCPDFHVEKCSFNQEDEIPSSSLTEDDTIYQKPDSNDFDCYDEEFLVEMVDPTVTKEEFNSNVGPTYERVLLPLPDNAFFPGPSPADFSYEGNSTAPSFESFSMFNVKTEPIYFISSNSSPVSTPEKVQEIPPQLRPPSSHEEPIQVVLPSQKPIQVVLPSSQETLYPKTPIKKNRSLKKKKSSSKRHIPPQKAKKQGSRKKKACLHCEATKTPQWRIGPSGAGTLCNACGILYKKQGKLYDEYRPVGSPSFVASVHSNIQKEVVKKKSRKDEWDWVECS